MNPLTTSMEQVWELISSHNTLGHIDELSVLIFMGDPNDDEQSELFERFVEETLPTVFGDLSRSGGLPTVFGCLDALEHCPTGIAVVVCGRFVMFPLLDLPQLSDELKGVLAEINSWKFKGPDDESELESFIDARLYSFRARSLAWLSTYMTFESFDSVCHWTYVQVRQYAPEGDEFDQVLMVITGPDDSGDYWTYSWTNFWGWNSDDNDLHSFYSWSSPTVTVTARNPHTDAVEFHISDDEGQIRFQTTTEGFQWIANYASKQGIDFVDNSSAEFSSNSGSVVSTTQSISVDATAVTVDGNMPRNRPTPVSPTPHVRPSTQAMGASVNSGIIGGNANVNGLAIISGIVQGDVNVPSGSDANISGIVQGTVRVSGGVARLYGTINAAEISSGRIEVYGILQSPLRYMGGDVYYAPGSIIAG